MRRLSAFLMIAALVAALVPSAALAGKVAPGIDTVVVSSLGVYPTTTDCWADVAVIFHGRASEARIVETGGTLAYQVMAPANNKTGIANVHYQLNRTKLGASDLIWKVNLVDQKGRELSAEVQTNKDKWFDAAACPVSGTLLAKYPFEG